MTNRPNPDQLLSAVQREGDDQRGRLILFLGYAAGVGKTYAMLQAAQHRHAEGVDIVVGYVETHGRAETDALLDGLEIVPVQQIEYRGVTLREMDLDAILTRRPEYVLVDELAHTNAPGTRHPKRYQDVLELLDAGINVYSTMNVQHLESLNDVVAQITEVVVRETVPDHVLEVVSEIRLIDLPVDELIQRLHEGKIYVPDQAARAVERFFRPGNLTALREIALRRTADRIDDKLRDYMQTHAISGVWPAGERLLVCVGPSPLSERLVRAAARLATNLNAAWTAAYVETSAALSTDDRLRVEQTLQLAEQLGAQTTTITGRSVAEAAIDYARRHNINRIVAGRPLQARWREWLRGGSIVDQIIRRAPDLDLYVISGEAERVERSTRGTDSQPGDSWISYGWSTLLVALTTLLALPLRMTIEPTNIAMVYFVAVIVAAVRLGRAPAIFASLLSVVAFDLVFILPYYTFVVADTQYLLTFGALLAVGIVVSTLAAQARRQELAARRRESQTAALYDLSRRLAGAVEADDIATTLLRHIEQTQGAATVVFTRDDAGALVQRATSDGVTAGSRTDGKMDSDEQAVATWVAQHGQPAGRFTETLVAAEGHYLPLRATGNTTDNTLGVVGIFFDEELASLPSERRRALELSSSQAALALERITLAADAQQTQFLRQAEQMQSALLNSISHDLRTPLATITGALSSLRDDAALLDAATQHDLADMAWDEARRLNGLVGNLLDMTRLESGALPLRRDESDVEDIVGAALTQLARGLRGREVDIDVPGDLPAVSVDFPLVVQALVNVVDNALKYSAEDAPLSIAAGVENASVVIEVADRGIGIPADERAHVFDKFYRAANGASGTGLGLAISKGVVDAHGGHIEAKPRAGGGTVVSLALPVG